MRVSFRCPVQGTEVSASAPLRKDDSLGSRVADRTKRRIGWGMKSALASTVRRAVGYGMAGSVASSAVYGATEGVGNNQSFSEAEQQAAIVQAFESVRSQFAWDAANNRFISAEAAGATQPELTRHLEAAPVVAPYDRGVLARMMAEIAAADGNLEADERNFFSYFITPDMGSLDEIVQRPPLSAAELAESSAGPVRETMLMLCWSLALSDGEVEAEEAARLAQLAEGLAIPKPRADELKGYAQAYLVDSSLGAVYSTGQRDDAAYQQVVAMGRAIGLSDEAIERIDIRFRKRYGLV
jgi:uncharacterized tellurite resistance protein B-like protein